MIASQFKIQVNLILRRIMFDMLADSIAHIVLGMQLPEYSSHLYGHTTSADWRKPQTPDNWLVCQHLEDMEDDDERRHFVDNMDDERKIKIKDGGLWHLYTHEVNEVEEWYEGLLARQHGDSDAKFESSHKNSESGDNEDPATLELQGDDSKERDDSNQESVGVGNLTLDKGKGKAVQTDSEAAPVAARVDWRKVQSLAFKVINPRASRGVIPDSEGGDPDRKLNIRNRLNNAVHLANALTLSELFVNFVDLSDTGDTPMRPTLELMYHSLFQLDYNAPVPVLETKSAIGCSPT